MEWAKQDYYRYMLYHNRYMAYTYSFKLESKLKETILEKVSISEERGSRIRDFNWVNNGLYRLFRSRRVLSYSYPFAYYMFGEELFKDEMTTGEREIKQNLFEDQQQQLESNVKKLSKFLEEPFEQYTDEKVMEVRMEVINLSILIDNLCRKMYECIESYLLGALQLGTHNIAPYKSKGIDQNFRHVGATKLMMPINAYHHVAILVVAFYDMIYFQALGVQVIVDALLGSVLGGREVGFGSELASRNHG